jgi:hypothetical protein
MFAPNTLEPKTRKVEYFGLLAAAFAAPSRNIWRHLNAVSAN